MKSALADPEWFWAKVDRRGPDECWLWKESLTRGYGNIHASEGRIAHRVAWLLLLGPVPDNLTLDHLCGEKQCVNPAHLEPVTNSENARRAIVVPTHCPNGHAYDETNTITYSRGNGHHGGRQCRACRKDERRLRYLRDRFARRHAGIGGTE